MRIISGIYGGRQVPAMKGLAVRPTTDRTREGLFNILQHRMAWEDQRVLDLCSGTGVVSLEFWSRGVREVVSVDRNRKCIQAQKRLLADFGILHAQIIMSDAKAYLKRNQKAFSIIFIDPPYDLPDQDEWVLEGLKGRNLQEDGWLILEHLKKNTFHHLSGFQFVKHYGSSSISFFCRDFS